MKRDHGTIRNFNLQEKLLIQNQNEQNLGIEFQEHAKSDEFFTKEPRATSKAILEEGTYLRNVPK